MTSGANHAATAHSGKSRNTHQEPRTLELALSVLPTAGTEFIQYLPGGEKKSLQAKHQLQVKLKALTD